MSPRNALRGFVAGLWLGMAPAALAASPGKAAGEPAHDVRTAVREALVRYANTGDSTTLGKALQQATEQAPRWAEAYYHLARLAIHEQRWADAVRAQERFLALASPGVLSRQSTQELPRLRALASAPAGSSEQRRLHYEWRLARAREALALGEHQEAVTEAMGASNLLEDGWEAPALASTAFLQLGADAEAAQLLGRALILAPDSEQGGLVAMLQAARRSARARDQLRAGANAHRQGQPAVAAQYYLQAYRLSGNPRHALAAAVEFALAKELDVGAQLLDVVLAESLPELSSQVAELRQKLPELAAVRATPAEAVQAYGRGRVALRNGDAAAAVLALREAVEKAPGHGPFMAALARAHLAAGSLEAAETTLTQLVEAQPRVAAWKRLLAQVRSRRGRAHEAVPVLQEALELVPGDEELEARLGLLLLEQERADEAKALSRGDRKHTAEGHRLEGELAMVAGDAETAVAAYREALRLDGWSPTLHLALSSALFKQQHPEEARKTAARVPRLQACCEKLDEQWEVAP